MNKLILSLAAVFALTFAASAQYTPILEGGTNNVAAAAGNVYSNYLDVSAQDNVAVSLKFKGGVVNTASNCIFRFQAASTADGLHDDTNNTRTVTVALNGTTNVIVVTNLIVTGLPYLKLVAIENTNLVSTHYMTNLEVGYVVKRFSPR